MKKKLQVPILVAFAMIAQPLLAQCVPDCASVNALGRRVTELENGTATANAQVADLRRQVTDLGLQLSVANTKLNVFSAGAGVLFAASVGLLIKLLTQRKGE